MMALLEIRDLVVRYGEIEALRGISLTVEQGKVVTLLGANGAGKSTTLRAISGLEKPASGDILFDGKSIVSAGNTNIAEENNPVVNNLFNQLEQASTDAARVSISQQIDMQVMKDAVMLPAVYSKALLYRGTNLANVNVNEYFGMYNYGVLGFKS